MEVIVTINNCGDCRHKDHSGAFTPGGAILICQHNDSPKIKEVSGVWDFRDITTKEIAEEVFGPIKLNSNKTIPEWCPLKHGNNY